MAPTSLRTESSRRLVLNSESETLSTRCTHCAKRLRVRRVHLNKHVRCPRCGRRTLVVAAAYLHALEAPDAAAPSEPEFLRRFAPLLMVLLAATFAGVGVFAGRVFFG